MANIFAHVPYRETGYFSKLVTDYIADEPAIRPFYRLAPTAAGVAQAIQQRSNFPVNRPVLVAALNRQYTNLTIHPKAAANINSLLDNNTYTVCTAHQPNLLTGYLYFIYKILHAIKLADELNTTHTGKHFVPVYYMGSEDNDLEELGTFRFRDDKYVWDGNGQTGAVGRMDTASLQPMLKKLFRVFGPPGKDCDQLQDLLS